MHNVLYNMLYIIYISITYNIYTYIGTGNRPWIVSSTMMSRAFTIIEELYQPYCLTTTTTNNNNNINSNNENKSESVQYQ